MSEIDFELRREIAEDTYYYYEGEKEAVLAAIDSKFAPPTWEERDVVHAFDDGWTIEMLRNKPDRSFEVGFLGGCTAGSQWVDYQEKGLVLMSLRAPDGTPHATLLFNPFPLPNPPETPYLGCRVKEEPRRIDHIDRTVRWGQFHSGWYGRDWEQESIQACKERVESWWITLEEVEAA